MRHFLTIGTPERPFFHASLLQHLQYDLAMGIHLHLSASRLVELCNAREKWGGARVCGHYRGPGIGLPWAQQ